MTSIAIGVSLLLAGFGAASASAAPTTMVNLGQASSYAVLSGASVANTVSAPGAPHTTIRGDLGIKADAAPGGFPPGVVTGTIRHGSTVDPAHADMAAAYGEIAARQGGAPLAGALVGVNLLPGLHTISGAASNTGTLTLDGGGDPDAVFVIQVNGALAFAAGSHVVLANKAQASRVFWQVAGAGAVGALSDFTGTLIARDAVTMGNGTLVNGRAFARDGALTLDNNQFYGGPPVVTIAGGDAAQTTDTTPTISGTTDLEAPATVSVTLAGQTLTATPVDGAWSVDSEILPNGTYPVVATVQDGAGNLGSTTQQLTIDTVLPEITIDGEASVTTNDPTPTISGTSDVAEDTVVRVTVGSQNLRALVNASGTWNVRPAALTDGNHIVTAAVSDPAANESTATQDLTIDTAAPTLTIAGGPAALTNDATPHISGTADVTAGTTVGVTVGNETLSGPVDDDEDWSVDAAALPDGPHRIVVSVSDAAGNSATATQVLTVDTVKPLVTINGGADATTERTDPTIAGTSDAAAGTIVSVSIAGNSMTALLQANGSWNTNAGEVGNGIWQVLASVQDPAGNVGTFTQTLTVGPAVNPPVTESYELSVSRTGNGRGTVSSSPAGISCGTDCSETYLGGSSATLDAEPAAGSDFTGWKGDCSGSSACTVGMDQDRAVEAGFALQKRSLSSSTTGNGSGDIASTPAGAEFDFGTTVTLTARSANGSKFTGWGGACSGTSTCTVTMDQARKVSAGFADDTPVISLLKMAPKKVSLSKGKNAIRRRGPAIKLSLTEDAKVGFRITRKSTKAQSFQLKLNKDSSSVRIPMKIRKKLRRGSYQLAAIATDSAGQDSKILRTGFKVVR